MSGFPLVLLKHYFVGINYCIDIVTFIISENTNLCILTGCGVRVFCVMFLNVFLLTLISQLCIVIDLEYFLVVIKFNSQYKFV